MTKHGSIKPQIRSTQYQPLCTSQGDQPFHAGVKPPLTPTNKAMNDCSSFWREVFAGDQSTDSQTHNNQQKIHKTDQKTNKQTGHSLEKHAQTPKTETKPVALIYL